jgi:tetrahydromethanopterin S-methyltransferase subunit B
MSNDDKTIAKIAEKFSDIVDLKMREYIVMVEKNRPEEQSNIIGALKISTKEIKDHLEEQDKRMDTFERKLDPIATAFAKTEKFKFVFKESGVTIVKVAGGVAIVTGAVTGLWAGIKYLLIHLLK